MAAKQNRIKEPPAFLWLMIPFVFFMNVLLFGGCIFTSASLFVRSFLFTALFIFISDFFFHFITIFFRKKYPSAIDLFKRAVYMLCVFYLLNLLLVPALFFCYNHWKIIDCPARQNMIYWTIIYACCFSTIFTFLNIGLINWEAWKSSLNETEKLKNIYQRSKVLGLKSQINPHFLFNCFNTLSGLIQEDEAKAEKFLDEMTKVHRYLLRSDDELLVSLESELRFAESYLYLAKGRFGDAVHFAFDIHKKLFQKMFTASQYAGDFREYYLYQCTK
jgi:two-component system, LytTR family, sensor kinase